MKTRRLKNGEKEVDPLGISELEEWHGAEFPEFHLPLFSRSLMTSGTKCLSFNQKITHNTKNNKKKIST